MMSDRRVRASPAIALATAGSPTVHQMTSSPWLKPGVSFQCRIKNAQHAFQNGDGFEKSGSIHPRTCADATVNRRVSRWALVPWFSGYLTINSNRSMVVAVYKGSIIRWQRRTKRQSMSRREISAALPETSEQSYIHALSESPSFTSRWLGTI